MGLFVSTLCIRFAKTVYLSILAIITNFLVQVISNKSLLFLSLNTSLSQLILMMRGLRLNLILFMGISTDKTSFFVGATVEENCKQFNFYVSLLNENTLISSQGILQILHENSTPGKLGNLVIIGILITPILSRHSFSSNTLLEHYG